MILLAHFTTLPKSVKTLAAIMVCITAISVVGCSQQKIKGGISNNSNSSNNIHNKLNSAELKTYQNAITSLSENELNTAKTLLQKLSKSRPKIHEIHYNLALINYKLNDLDGAKSSLEQALKLNPEDPQFLVLLGAIETKKGHINLAENLYIKAINHNENYANAHYNLALLYDIYYQDIHMAAEHYQRYLELTNYKDKQTVVWLEEINGLLNLKTQPDLVNSREPLAQLENNQIRSSATNAE